MEMEIHLFSRLDLRDRLSKNFAVFKLIIPEIKGKEGKNRTITEKTNIDAGTKKKATDLLSPMHMDIAAFVDTYKMVYPKMESQPTRNDCLSKDLATRLISSSSIVWNSGSHNKQRDFPNLATAFTLETPLVRLYRQNLIDTSIGAARLRSEFHALFVSASLPRTVTGPDGGSKRRGHWEFADLVPVGDIASHPAARPLAVLMPRWKAARESYLLPQKDPVLSLLQLLEGNEYLHCSAPGVAAGTLETLAHYFIDGLVAVSATTAVPFFICPLPLFFPFRSPP